MERVKRVKLLAIGTLVLAFAAVPPKSSAQAANLVTSLGKAMDYFGVADFYFVKTPSVYSSYKQCLAKGHAPDLCNSVFSYCMINNLPLGGIAGAFINEFQLNQLFSVDCGSGTCFACCFVPGSGCHTSFHSDYNQPVINCNENYGGGTREVGLSNVTDPNAQPGQLCLFTPQTCDHLGACSSARTPLDIQTINANPSHIIKSNAAIANRARNFAAGLLGDWSNYLSSFHTSAMVQNDSIRQSAPTLTDLGGFITGRGCAGWRAKTPLSAFSDWSEPAFRINTASGVYTEEPSHYNGVRQLGLVRLLASLPNLKDRLSYVESQIWTSASAAQYLTSVSNPDAVFLQNMSSIALDLLKRNKQLQDYRLLSVPLPGETALTGIMNGCVLSPPPSLTLSYQTGSPFEVRLSLTSSDSQGSSSPVLALALWGDGSTSRINVPPGNQAQSISHEYRSGGKYQVVVIAENEAGLRTVGALVVQTVSTSVNSISAPEPVLSEIQVVDLQARVETGSGDTPSMLFELENWTSDLQGSSLGRSRSIEMPFNSSVLFGTIAGWNMNAAPFRKLTIKPYRFGQGYLVGFRRNLFTVGKLRLGFYSTQLNKLIYKDVQVTPDMIRVFRKGSTLSQVLQSPTYNTSGQLELIVEAGGIQYERFDFLIPDSVFASAAQGPVTDGSWVGLNGTISESKPIERSFEAPGYPLSFYTVAPCRLVDTRGPIGPRGAPRLFPYPDRRFFVTKICGIPEDARAVSLNVTVTGATAQGSINIVPGWSGTKNTSSVSFGPGATRAALTVMGLARDGSGAIDVHLDSTGNAQIILDVTGYFR